MADRGEYRAIYVAMIDDPDYQALTPAARLSLLSLKLILGPSGIGVVRALAAELVALTGHSAESVEGAIGELEAGGWILREGAVVWLRNGLRYEPSKPLASENGRKGVSAHLATLPRVALVNRFAAYYGLPCPFPELGEPDPLPDPLRRGSVTPSEPPTEAGKREEGIGNREKHPSSSAGGGARLRVVDGGVSGDREDQISAVIREANAAMARNAAIDQRRLRPIPVGHGSRQAVADWIEAGIALDLIREVVRDRAGSYQPDAHHRQISTMTYFDGAVREAAERARATTEGEAHGEHSRGAGSTRATRGDSRRATPRPTVAALGAGDPSRRSGWVYE